MRLKIRHSECRGSNSLLKTTPDKFKASIQSSKRSFLQKPKNSICEGSVFKFSVGEESGDELGQVLEFETDRGNEESQ